MSVIIHTTMTMARILIDEASILPSFVALEGLHILAACISSLKEKTKP